MLSSGHRLGSPFLLPDMGEQIACVSGLLPETGDLQCTRQKVGEKELLPWIQYVQGGMFCVDTDETTDDNELIRALKKGDTSSVGQHAQSGPLLHSRDTLGNTPLHIAAKLGLEESTKILITSGARLDMRTRNNTPLQAAIFNSEIGIVQYFWIATQISKRPTNETT